jgi:hypothetical protein
MKGIGAVQLHAAGAGRDRLLAQLDAKRARVGVHGDLNHVRRARAFHLAGQKVHRLVDLDLLLELLLVTGRSLGDQQRERPRHRARTFRQLSAVQVALVRMELVAVVVEQQRMGQRRPPHREHPGMLGAEPIGPRIAREIASRRARFILGPRGAVINRRHRKSVPAREPGTASPAHSPGVPYNGFRTSLSIGVPAKAPQAKRLARRSGVAYGHLWPVADSRKVCFRAT